MSGMPEYRFGYDPTNKQFILWKTGKSREVARISFENAATLMDTVQHVYNVEREREQA